MVNKCIFVGRVGRDPESRVTADGTAVASFSLAVSESWKDKSGTKQEKTEWINCTAWRRLAEIIGQYLKKGSLVYVEGKMQSREYDGKDGVKRKVTEIVINDMKMLGGGKNEGTGSSASSRPAPSSQHDDDFPAETEDDDFPL
jgi:single-strand DNA-binding protein